MEWWQGFWGWAITAGLAAIAAIGVVTQEVRHWRARPWGRFEIRSLGTIDADGEPRWKVFTFANTGTINIGVLLFAIFGVKQEYPPPGDEYVIPRTVKISESRKFAVQHGPTDRAWILLTAEHPRKRGATILTWHPLDDEGPLNDEYLRQLENEHRFTQRVLRRVRNERRPVGPGGVTRRVISSKTRQPSGDTFVVELPKHLS
ncbi:hypothetical protein JCM11754A_06160 [Isoptericola variabilis]